ncbi:MAG: hypothetical protein QM730_05270 [Anaerolineales bacterium]
MNKLAMSVFLLVFILLLSSCSLSNRVTASKTCNMDLQISVRQGDSANLNLSGEIAFGSSQWTSFEGNLVEENGTSHPVSFYFNGKVLNFTLDLEQGRIYGTGVMESELAACSGTGGGTLSGPMFGDLGDWRAQWISEGSSVPVQPSNENNSIRQLILVCFYAPIVLIGLLVFFYLFRLFAPYKLIAPFKRKHSSNNKPSTPALKKVKQEAKPVTGKDIKPITEYQVTYVAGDRLFDLSFEIERSSHYFGECGVTIAKELDVKSNQATALELWLFETQSKQTVSKILASNYCFSQNSLRGELEQKGEVILI